MAHLASGNGWQTTFVLVNTGSSAAPATLNSYDNNGNPLPLPLTFPQSPQRTGGSCTHLDAEHRAVNASLWIQSVGPVASALLTGSAQLTTTGDMSGFVIFRYNPNGQEAVVPVESRNAPAYTPSRSITRRENGDGDSHQRRFVARHGLRRRSVDTARGCSGPCDHSRRHGCAGGDAIGWPAPNGHSSLVLSQQFPATANIRGTIEFDAPQAAQISVLGYPQSSRADVYHVAAASQQ